MNEKYRIYGDIFSDGYRIVTTDYDDSYKEIMSQLWQDREDYKYGENVDGIMSKINRLNDDEVLELLDKINDKYKTVIRKNKLKNIDEGRRNG